jgi:hypothetical protein
LSAQGTKALDNGIHNMIPGVVKAVDLMLQEVVIISTAVVEMGHTADRAPGSSASSSQGSAMQASSDSAMSAARDGKGALCAYQDAVDNEAGIVAWLLDQFATDSQTFFYLSWAVMVLGLAGSQTFRCRNTFMPLHCCALQ